MNPEKSPDKSFATVCRTQKCEKLFRLATDQLISGMRLNAFKNFRKLLTVDKGQDQELQGIVNLCLGFLENINGRLDSSLEYFQKGLESFFCSYGVQCELTGAVTANIGSTFFEMEDYMQALDFQKNALTIVENLENTEAMQAAINFNIALVHHKLGNHNMSLELCKQSLEECLAVGDENAPSVGDVFSLIADNLWKMKVYEDSFDFLNKSFKIYQDNFGDDDLKVAHAREKMAIYQAEFEQNFEEALENMNQALQIKKKLLEDHPSVASTYSNIARLHLMKEDHDAAITNWTKSNRILTLLIDNVKALPWQDSSSIAWCESFLSSLYGRYSKNSHGIISSLYNGGKFREAKAEITNFEGTVPRESVSRSLKVTIASLKSMIELFLGNSPKAYQLAIRALDLCRLEFGPKHQRTAELTFRLGVTCKELGKLDESIIYLSSAKELGDSGETSTSYDKIKPELEAMIQAIN